MPAHAKQQLLISRGWIQAVGIVILFGFFVLGFLAYETYTDAPPIPQRVADSSGAVLFSSDDIMAGQEIFLRNGLMEYGSIFGHGAYLGPISPPIISIELHSLPSITTAATIPTALNCRS